MLEIIGEPAKWMLVSSAFPPEMPAEENPRHAAWMAKHSHTHIHQEFLMTLTGEGWQGFRGQVYPRRPGTAFYFQSFEPHDFFVPPWATDETQLWISLLPSHIIAWTHSIRTGVFTTQPRWRQVISREQIGASDIALAGNDSAAALSPAVRRLHLQSFLGICLSLVVHAGSDPEAIQETMTTQQEIIQAIQHHIEETAGRGVTVEQLARLSGYSKFHLLRLFKQFTGTSIHTYINECRQRRILELQAVGYNQKAIAAALGFSCPSAYAHWYKRYRQAPDGE